MKTFESWVKWFRQEILDASLEEGQVNAFLLHLADLDKFRVDDNDIWSWVESSNSEKLDEKFASQVSKSLVVLSQTECGWAIGFFLRGVAELYQPPNMPPELFFDLSKEKERQSPGNPVSADLSNFHIVRKVGRQLSPFLEMENRYIERLSGKYLNRTEAQKLYRYILKKSRPSAKPLPWQQLSRRRHK